MVEILPGSRPRLQHSAFGAEDDDDDGYRDGVVARQASPTIVGCDFTCGSLEFFSCGGAIDRCDLSHSKDTTLKISGAGTTLALRNTSVERGWRCMWVCSGIRIERDVPLAWMPGPEVRVYDGRGEVKRAAPRVAPVGRRRLFLYSGAPETEKRC